MIKHSPKAKDTRFHNYMLLKFEVVAKNVRPRPKGLEAKAEAEARGYETEAKMLASMPVWPRSFNMSGFYISCMILYNILYFNVNAVLHLTGI